MIHSQRTTSTITTTTTTMEHERSPKRPKMEQEKPPECRKLNGLAEWTYQILILPEPIPEKLDIKKVIFVLTEVKSTPEQKAFCNNIKEQIGTELFDDTAKILSICRNDWDVLRPSSQAFLINRMIDSNYKTSLCCRWLLKYMKTCPCVKKPNRLCCHKEKDICDEVHSLFKVYDYVSSNKQPSFLAEK